MNERIQLLAEEAWEDTAAVTPEFGHPAAFAEKFAELILRKCIEEIKRASPMGTHDDPGELSRTDQQHQWAFRESVIVIREYFGVK